MGSPWYSRVVRTACIVWCLTAAAQTGNVCGADVPAATDSLRGKSVAELQTLLAKQFDENRCLEAVDTAVVLTEKIRNKRAVEWATAKSYEGRCYFRLTDGPIRPQVKQELLLKSLGSIRAANAVFSRLPQKTAIVSHSLVNMVYIADVFQRMADSADTESNYRQAEETLSIVSDVLEKRTDMARTSLAGYVAMKKGDFLHARTLQTADQLKKSQLLRSALKEYRKAISYDYRRQQPEYATWIHGRTAAVLASLGSLHGDEGYYRQAITSYQAMLNVPGRPRNFFADVNTNLKIIVLRIKAAVASIRS